MKRIVTTLFLLFAELVTYASVNVTCDVIYKNKNGEWSDFLRTRVTFCLGHEINEILESRTVFAVIWSPDNQRIVLKMKDSRPQTQELDMFNIFLLLCTNDMLNQCVDFELYKADIEQQWKIYAKDKIGLLIDDNLASTQAGATYNEGTMRNRSNGFYIDRERPKDDPKHPGDCGDIVYKDNWRFYIIKVNGKYIAMERNDCYMIKAEIGDKIVGDFIVTGVQKEFYSKTRDVDGYMFTVLKSFETREDCERFIKTKWPN